MEISFDLKEQSGTGQLYLSCPMPDNTEFDPIAIKTADHTKPAFLLPMQKKGYMKTLELQYYLDDNYIGMNEHKFRVGAFLAALRNIVSTLMNCDDYFLKKNNFYLDSQYISVNKNNMDVKFIYVPILNDICTDDKIINKVITLIRKTTIINGTELKGQFFERLDYECSLSDIHMLIGELENDGHGASEAARCGNHSAGSGRH